MTRQILAAPAGVSADRWDAALAAAFNTNPALWDDDVALDNAAFALLNSGVAL